MRALLIPSATLIPNDMRSKMGAIPSCLFPLHNVTMLERICEQYKNAADEVYVVAGHNRERLHEYAALKSLDVHVIDIDAIRNLGYTIWFGVSSILREHQDVEQIYVNYGDTLLSNQPAAERRDVLYYSRESISKEWTFFEHDNGRIRDVVDKGHAVASGAAFGNAFPGVFEIARPASFLRELEKALRAPAGDLDPFYQAVWQYSATRPFACVLAEDWFDVGHSDRYAQAKTMVAARLFNSIEIDRDRGLLTKRSRNREKLIDEIKWYLRMPSRLQYLTPRIYSYSLDWSDPYVTMEYYGYNTLHEMLVYGDITEPQWRKIFRKLLFILEDMRCFQVNDDAATRREVLEQIYVSKTISRLEELKNDEHFTPFFENRITVDGAVFPSLEEYIGFLPPLLRSRLVEDAPAFCIIHGDLCFSNILAENDFGFLRLVDPRGSFGGYDIYGDQRYEIAKLMHSLDGQYDFIIEDMVHVAVEGACIQLRRPPRKQKVSGIFQDVFHDYMSDWEDLKLIEGLLFLSMIPLHSDHVNRQYAMLATGLQLLREAGIGESDG